MKTIKQMNFEDSEYITNLKLKNLLYYAHVYNYSILYKYNKKALYFFCIRLLW